MDAIKVLKECIKSLKLNKEEELIYMAGYNKGYEIGCLKMSRTIRDSILTSTNTNISISLLEEMIIEKEKEND